MNYVRLAVVDAFRLLKAIFENLNTGSPNTVMKDLTLRFPSQSRTRTVYEAANFVLVTMMEVPE